MRLVVGLIVVFVLACSPGALIAAGREPVRLETPHFVFVHNGKGANLAKKLAEIAEGRRRYIRHLVGLGPDGDEKIEVRIAINDDEMQAMTGSGGRVDHWVAGITFIGQDLIVMSARGNEFFKASDTFVHELAHYYLDEMTGDRPVPRWFHEGFAMLASDELIGDRMHSLLAAAATGSIFELSELDTSFPSKEPAVHLAYAQSMFFVRFLQNVSGNAGVPALIDDMRVGMPFEAAFQSTWGGTPEELFVRFRDTFSPVDSVIAFLTSATLIWALVVGVFVFVYLRKKKMAARKIEMWELEDELQRERILRVLDSRTPDEPRPDQLTDDGEYIQ